MPLITVSGVEAFIWLMLCFALMSERRTGAVIESVEALKLVAMLCSGSGVGCK